ncbi:thioredoxin domain-containing protein [Pantoea sp. C2G6]|uniref:DsbA family protein n=1 Tax=Pantoea sp. C2G6 TaxID=3243084 RepID=UPI003EDA5C04
MQQANDAEAVSKAAQAPSPDAEALFTPQQEARIGEVVKAYLLKHPELLIEVDQKLQQIQYDEQITAMTAAALQHQDALLNDKSVPSIGPADASVVLVEFFDYQCIVCARQAVVMQSLMKNNPQVRFVFQEWPIFGARWKPSFNAAETGLRIWQQKGGDAYMNYHNALFATGHTEGALTQKDITAAAGKTKLKGKESDMLTILSRTDILAKNVGFQGTPGIIVMPASGATADKVTVFPGGAVESMLQQAIDKAAAPAAE